MQPMYAKKIEHPIALKMDAALAKVGASRDDLVISHSIFRGINNQQVVRDILESRHYKPDDVIRTKEWHKVVTKPVTRQLTRPYIAPAPIEPKIEPKEVKPKKAKPESKPTVLEIREQEVLALLRSTPMLSYLDTGMARYYFSNVIGMLRARGYKIVTHRKIGQPATYTLREESKRTKKP